MIYEWEIQKAREWTTDTIRNMIWREVNCGQPVPGAVSVEALRQELINRGEEPIGFHNS